MGQMTPFPHCCCRLHGCSREAGACGVALTHQQRCSLQEDRLDGPSLEAAVPWLRHCQRFDLEKMEAESVAVCEQAIAKQFLQRRELLEILTPASLLRMSHAYARAIAQVLSGPLSRSTAANADVARKADTFAAQYLSVDMFAQL
jgi:hypothetical protein